MNNRNELRKIALAARQRIREKNIAKKIDKKRKSKSKYREVLFADKVTQEVSTSIREEANSGRHGYVDNDFEFTVENITKELEIYDYVCRSENKYIELAKHTLRIWAKNRNIKVKFYQKEEVHKHRGFMGRGLFIDTTNNLFADFKW